MRTQKRRKPRNPYALALRRLGHKVKPNKKRYTRKGRSQDRPFGLWAATESSESPLGRQAVVRCYVR